MGRAPVRAMRARFRLRSAFVRSPRFASFAVVASLSAGLALAGCGGKKHDEAPPLGFEFDTTATDTTKLTQGRAILSAFQPYRASNGAIRVRGKLALPDGARLQVSLRRTDGTEIGREQVLLQGGGFDTPPFLAPGGRAFPAGRYAFELSTQFNSVWQPENVLLRTRNGLDLTGPGMRRGNHGEAIFRITMEQSL
jgi:hypothetical protein